VSPSDNFSASPDSDSPDPTPPTRPPGSSQQRQIRRMRDGKPPRGIDSVATEEPLEIRLCWQESDGGKERAIAVTMRTPGNDSDLAAGFLLTEGIIEKQGDITGISHCTEGDVEQHFNIVRVVLRDGVSFDLKLVERNFYTSSSCGVCGKASIDAIRARGCMPVASGPVVSATVIRQLPEKLRAAQDIFDRTGGIHASGVFDGDGEILLLREDVGRHNALDKVIGSMLLNGELPASERVLLVSGRASFELVQKAAVAGFPLVAAVGAPSSLAVETAERFGVTLLGFVSNSGFNIYSGDERVGGSR